MPATNFPATNTYGSPTAKLANSTTNNATVLPTSTTAGSKCAPCILSGGVWCSRTYAYVSTSATLQGQNLSITGMSLFPNNNASSTGGTPAIAANMIGGAALDGGSCCATKV